MLRFLQGDRAAAASAPLRLVRLDLCRLRGWQRVVRSAHGSATTGVQ
jgi:hypothetical protein